ncbi:hypothetical protein [Xanthobacter flavus]|uniref:GumK N-terminal domain-containing glycosyltransferase n=1 Tax=Xanthobacter flavus TaxID=281 RepID=UPI001AE9FA8F|nr:hypothetical protein [Xanthobacter flavus]MBP2151675.1 2-beta-glucuronyltransferase [Xanthobacter flavus]
MTFARCVSIFSYHLYFQRRRGGMHWVCDSLRKAGWDVRFITCDYSLLTLLKGDKRTAYGEVKGINRLERVTADLSVGVVFTPFHPVGRDRNIPLKLIDKLTSTYPQPKGGVVRKFAHGSDLVIVESCGALMMVDDIRRATDAPIVYRVSDNMRVVRPVPSLLAAEARAVGKADAVSLASEHLARSFLGRGRVQFDPMGLDKARFDAATKNPYPDDGRPKVVISGSSSLDHAALETAARSLTDFTFIQFGAADRKIDLPNLEYRGEVPFDDLVPYVKFADIGFAPYLVRPGFEYQAEHSNRLLQYVYSGLPSVVPMELASPQRPHYLGYDSRNDASIVAAFHEARAFDRALVPRDEVIDWDQVAARLAAVERQLVY